MAVKLNAFNQSSFFRTDEMRFKLDLGFAIKNILVCQSSLSQLVSNIYILFLENICKRFKTRRTKTLCTASFLTERETFKIIQNIYTLNFLNFQKHSGWRPCHTSHNVHRSLEKPGILRVQLLGGLLKATLSN